MNQCGTEVCLCTELELVRVSESLLGTVYHVHVIQSLLQCIVILLYK